MKFRIAIWASLGLLVAGGWALYAYITFPFTSERMRDVWTLITLTCPVAVLGKHHAISLYEAAAANTVIYAALGFIVEALRRRLNNCRV
jgi:hypothetical protein